MAKTEAGIQQKSFSKSFQGVPAGVGSTSKLLTRIQRRGLQQFEQSPERALQIQLLQKLSRGDDFGLSPEEAGRIQEQGRGAQDAAFRTAQDQIGEAAGSGGVTEGQRLQLLRGASLSRAAGLADFQRQEFLRKLQEQRNKPLFQLQSIESLSNALTGIPNFNQFNELMRTRILAQQAQAGQAQPGGGGGGGGPSPFAGLAGQAVGGLGGSFLKGI